MKTKKIKLTLSADASYKSEKDMGKAAYAQHVKAIAADFLKTGYMVQVVKGRTLEDHANALRIFDVVDEVWNDTGLKVTAAVIDELVDASLLMRRWVDGTEVYLHMNHETFGFNTASNYGLPKGIRLGQLLPGRLLKVRFNDYNEDVTAILIQRDRNPKSANSEVDAQVLVMHGPEKFEKVGITLNQVMELGEFVGHRL